MKESLISKDRSAAGSTVGQPRVIVLGLDAMTPELAEKWMAEGKLENLAKIARTGAYGRLRSTLPPASPPAWTTFLTGLNPGKHGIFGFAQRKPGSYHQTPVNASHCLGETIAQIVSTAGKTVGLLFMPLTYPPQAVNGFVVSGMGTPNLRTQFSHPPHIKEELLAVFGAEKIAEPQPRGKSVEEYVSSLEQSIQDKAQIVHYMLDKYPHLDLFVTVFTEIDRVQHFAWHYMDRTCPGYVPDAPAVLRDAILHCYQLLDRVVGEIATRLDLNTTLLIMSDHGAGPYQKFVDLNRWLEKEGFLTFTAEEKEHQTTLLARLYSLWRRGPRRILSISQRQRLRRFLPTSIDQRIAVQMRNSVLARIDWSQTRAFSEGADGLISLNQQGREPQGIVAEGTERDELLDEIARRLVALRDPDTREPVVERVYRREELYHGPGTSRAADLIVTWYQQKYHSLAIWTGAPQIFHQPGQWWGTSDLDLSGHHLREGIVFAQGPDVPAGLDLDGAQIVDLPATILNLLDLAVPKNLDGTVLDKLCASPARYAEDDGFLAGEHDSHSDDVYSKEDEATIEEMLRGLGYLG